jgi:hypothetical protein
MAAMESSETKKKLANDEAERARQRALVEEIKRWRVGKDRGAKPGSTIAELIKVGRRR